MNNQSELFLKSFENKLNRPKSNLPIPPKYICGKDNLFCDYAFIMKEMINFYDSFLVKKSTYNTFTLPININSNSLSLTNKNSNWWIREKTRIENSQSYKVIIEKQNNIYLMESIYLPKYIIYLISPNVMVLIAQEIVKYVNKGWTSYFFGENEYITNLIGGNNIIIINDDNKLIVEWRGIEVDMEILYTTVSNLKMYKTSKPPSYKLKLKYLRCMVLKNDWNNLIINYELL